MVLQALTRFFLTVFATAIYTELRKGELPVLHKVDVNLESLLLTIGQFGTATLRRAGKCATTN